MLTKQETSIVIECLRIEHIFGNEYFVKKYEELLANDSTVQ